MLTSIEKVTTTERPFKERYFEARQKAQLIGRVGEMALDGAAMERRFDEELESGFSEALSGRVVSEYDFSVSGTGKVLAADGEELEQTMLRARMRAYEEADENPELSFVIDRYNVELDELYEQQTMLRGETEHNAILTISPMTFELAHRPDLLLAGHQRPDLTRSLVRIALWDGKRYTIFTRSLDSSSLDLLKRSAGKATGHAYRASNSLDLLAERQYLKLSREEALKMLGDIAASFDGLLLEKTGRHTLQGASRLRDQDLLEYVRRHPQVLHSVRTEVEGFIPYCTSYADFEAKLELVLYNHLALLEEGLKGEMILSNGVAEQAGDAGKRAADNGVVFSMCGDVISSNSLRAEQVASGYESLMSLAGRRVKCPNLRCQKLVVVEEKHLRKGILHCSACKHTVDVCGDSVKAERIKKSEMNKAIAQEERMIRKARKLLHKKEPKDKQKILRIWFLGL